MANMIPIICCVCAAFVAVIAIICAYNRWHRLHRNPKTPEFGMRWCRERGYIYRQIDNKDGGDPIRWWGVDMKGRHHKYHKGDE